MSYFTQADSYPYYAEAQSRRQWDPLLAALPHLWLGAIIFLALLDGHVLTGLPDNLLLNVSDISLVMLLAVGLVVAVYASRNDQPLWTASWSGHTLLAMAAVPGRLVTLRNDENWVYAAGFLVLAVLALLIGYFLRFRRQPLHALLMVLVLLFGPLFFLETIPAMVEALYTAFLALLAASLAAFIVVTRGWALAAVCALVASLLANLVMVYVSTAHTEASFPAGGGLLMAAGALLASSLLSIIILFGPWLFWSAADSTRSKLG